MWHPLPVYTIKKNGDNHDMRCFRCARHFAYAEKDEEWISIADEHFCRTCYDQTKTSIAALMKDCIDTKIPVPLSHVMCDIEYHGEYRRLPCEVIEHYLRCASQPSIRYNHHASASFIRSLWYHLYYGANLKPIEGARMKGDVEEEEGRGEINVYLRGT